MSAHSAVIVLVVDQTLVMVSACQGSAPSGSRLPPQRSTTSSPSSATATDAPTSSPLSRFAVKAARTGSNRGSQRPPTSAIGPPLQRIELGEERLQRRRVAVDPAAARQRVGEGDPPPDEQHQLAGVEPQGGARALAAWSNYWELRCEAERLLRAPAQQE